MNERLKLAWHILWSKEYAAIVRLKDGRYWRVYDNTKLITKSVSLSKKIDEDVSMARSMSWRLSHFANVLSKGK